MEMEVIEIQEAMHEAVQREANLQMVKIGKGDNL
jgi:hypothetical protein